MKTTGSLLTYTAMVASLTQYFPLTSLAGTGQDFPNATCTC
jgi:hypothetical protein